MAIALFGDSMVSGMCLNSTAMLPYTNSAILFINPTTNTGGNADFIRTYFDAQPMRRNWAHVFWIGQHISGTAQYEADATTAMIDLLPHSQFVVVSAFSDPHVAAGQGPAGADYVKITAYNNIMRARYPTKFVDLKATMVADGVLNADSQSTLYDGAPSYWCPTDIHFNSDGSVKAALEIFNFEDALGHLNTAELRRQIAASGGI